MENERACMHAVFVHPTELYYRVIIIFRETLLHLVIIGNF